MQEPFPGRRQLEIQHVLNRGTSAYPGYGYNVYYVSSSGQLKARYIENYSFAELIVLSDNITPEFRVAIRLKDRIRFFQALDYDYKVLHVVSKFRWIER